MRAFVHGSWCLAIAFLLAVLAGPSVARAAGAEDVDEAERIEARFGALEDAVREHRRDKGAIDDLLADIRSAVSLYQQACGLEQSADLCKDIVKAVGSLTKVRDETVQKAALAALGTMGHASGARYVRSFLRVVDDARDAALVLAAVDAAEALRDDALVPPLLRIVDDAEILGVASAAMKALGAFGSSKRYREKILEELASTLVRDVPGGPKRGQESQVSDAYIPGKNGNGGTPRWQALSAVLPEALNRLTGHKLATAGDWMQIVREHKRDLKALFAD